MPTPTDGVTRVHVVSTNVLLPDSLKQGSTIVASGNVMVPIGPVANALSVPISPAATSAAAACGGGGGASPQYTESRVDFAPEASPNTSAFARDLSDDGYFSRPIGFDFTFYGNTYNSVVVYSNGFVGFGNAQTASADGGFIPSATTPNNIIALAWADWSPQQVADGIRFETRGSAPNRKFILQFNNVPEYHSTGILTSQVVLSEGTNEITIYTNQMNTVNSGHVITQGIENATGSLASYDTFMNTAGTQMARVKNRFQLTNDAIRFTPVSAKDEVAPTFDAAPVDLSQNNDPGLATAVVAVAPPTAQDNCSAVTITGVRSDGLSLDAPYHVGVTTITWTAKDADGNTSTETQTVTVIDVDPPVWDDVTVASVWTRNATSPLGAVVEFDNVPVTDNVGVTSRSCEPASGSVFPIGSTPVVCTAFDAAGNSASKTFTVVVISAHEQIGNLIDRVEGLNLPDGTLEPIVNQLLSAYDQTADGSAACKKVSDFMSMVQKKNSNIQSGDVAFLLNEGSRILSVMDCAPARNAQVLSPTLRGIP
ncbi:MAG TPA: HYR domain-containing protein [Gemmatimonadaceae bacterium]|nr:HYR domain-containing protein [Gemmatimonadaceae bacterium]